MTKKRFRKYFKLTDDEYYGRVRLSRHLSGINRITVLPEDFSPKNGWSLDLSSMKEIPKGLNPSIEHLACLYLRSIIEIPEHFNPTNCKGTICIGKVKSIPERLKHLNFEIVF